MLIMSSSHHQEGQRKLVMVKPAALSMLHLSLMPASLHRHQAQQVSQNLCGSESP